MPPTRITEASTMDISNASGHANRTLRSVPHSTRTGVTTSAPTTSPSHHVSQIAANRSQSAYPAVARLVTPTVALTVVLNSPASAANLKMSLGRSKTPRQNRQTQPQPRGRAPPAHNLFPRPDSSIGHSPGFRRGKPPKTRRARGVDVLRPEFRDDQRDAREISRLSSQFQQTPYSLMCVSERPVLTAARYAVDGSIPRARAKHSSQKLRGFCATRNAATFSLAIIVS